MIREVFSGEMKHGLKLRKLQVFTHQKNFLWMTWMLWRWPCTLCPASRGLWTCTMACMLPLTKKRQPRRGKKPKKMLLKRNSLVRLASVKAGKVLRHLEPTSEHAGDTDCEREVWWHFHPAESQSRRSSCSNAQTVDSPLKGSTSCVNTWRWQYILACMIGDHHSKGKEGEASHVCPLHCGAAFSTQVRDPSF